MRIVHGNTKVQGIFFLYLNIFCLTFNDIAEIKIDYLTFREKMKQFSLTNDETFFLTEACINICISKNTDKRKKSKTFWEKIIKFAESHSNVKDFILKFSSEKD